MFIDFFKLVEKFNEQEDNIKFFSERGINSKINKEALIALYFENNDHNKMHAHEFPLIKEAKWRNGALTKYDIPQYIRNIPEEYSAICTLKEAGMIKNFKKKEEKEKEKEKKKKMQMDLEHFANNKEKEKENNSKEANNKNNQNSNKKKDVSKEKKVNPMNNNNNLEEPLPNEMHKYCHLCKKPFDNYIRHINSKGHKDTALKYKDTFNSIKNVFSRINTFWNNKKDNNENIQRKNNVNKKSNELTDIVEKLENENEKLNEYDNIKKRMLSQLNKSIKEGCQAKKKLITIHSQLSTAQSSPMLAPVKRKKNNLKGKSKSKKNKCIKEFLIRGELINYKKTKDE